MGLFILRRLGVMILTAICLTFIVFWLTNLTPNLEKLAKTQGNFRMSDEAVTSYLTNRGYTQPLPVKYGQWLGVLPGYEIEGSDGETRRKCAEGATFCGVLQGKWGFSTVFREDVSEIIATRLALTGKLMFWVMMVMVPGALIIGVLAGMREGSRTDRSLSIVLKHALRNALIAPFTVIMLQIPWLLNGVVIVETLFNYKGFGWTLVQAASNNDIELLLGVSVVSVFVVLVTQLISDIGYVFLNPRIRIS